MIRRICMKKTGRKWAVLRVIITIIAIFLLYYFQLPPLHPRSRAFWGFLFEVIVLILVFNSLSTVLNLVNTVLDRDFWIENLTGKFSLKRLFAGFAGAAGNGGKFIAGGLAMLLLILVLQLVGDVIGHPLFHSKAYSQLVSPAEADFAADVSEISMKQIPVVDRDSASRLGNRKLGEIADLVSQFEITDLYTQINYQGTPYRVTPLQYGDVIKWFANQSQGLPAYLKVNMVTQETTLNRLSEGMKYSPSEYFFRNINRYLRICYPTKIFDFDDVSFEIDEDGTPYWVASIINYRIGIWSGKDIAGAVLVNAITGEHKYYDLADIPAWVDQVFISDLIMQQLDYNGMYRNGFINSIFGQKGVRRTTQGYNYIAIGDDVYLYTGITSVTSDDSNIGFDLVNLRTKEASYYSVPGATEYSAMDSAEGQVQQMKYVATFPILLNISDRPTYFLSLKDDAGLVKMYAFVDVEQYQVVGTGTSVAAARTNYETALGLENEGSGSGSITPSGGSGTPEGNTADLDWRNLEESGQVTAAITDIQSVVISGYTRYYMLLEGDDHIYQASATVSPSIAFLKAGDEVTLSYADTEDPGLRTVLAAEKAGQ